MNITIDIEAITRLAKQYQDGNQDFSYPFWMAFRDLYPAAGDAAERLLSEEIEQ